MSRDTKIMMATSVLQIVVAAAKSGASSPDQLLEVAKSELFPLAVNLGGLFMILKLIKA